MYGTPSGETALAGGYLEEAAAKQPLSKVAASKQSASQKAASKKAVSKVSRCGELGEGAFGCIATGWPAEAGEAGGSLANLPLVNVSKHRRD